MQVNIRAMKGYYGAIAPKDVMLYSGTCLYWTTKDNNEEEKRISFVWIPFTNALFLESNQLSTDQIKELRTQLNEVLKEECGNSF